MSLSEAPVFRSHSHLPPVTLPSTGLRFPSEPSWAFPGKRQGCPGVCSGPSSKRVCRPELGRRPQCVCVWLWACCASLEWGL